MSFKWSSLLQDIHLSKAFEHIQIHALSLDSLLSAFYASIAVEIPQWHFEQVLQKRQVKAREHPT